ncbi:glycosyltransferase [Longilinea arvoryzae]|uniref:Glycosyltransferase n=1 Tax=Longilinea arvoryzae TaxID=360412 RepID=A0A0S7BET2_9CHLR|nr:glycosyltransferase family 4 protein [Longilinea arvoryzae]GAP13472.1 glycosyltransferase [Longilinea arvoryzae]
MARIAVFHNLPSGGAKRALFEWTRRLAERHTLDVFSLSTANHGYCDLRPYTSDYQIADFEPLALFASPWGRLNQLQRWRDLGRLQAVYRRLAARIDAGGYDVVFSNSCSFTFIPLLQLYLQTPSVYYLHEHFANLVRRDVHRPYLKQNSARQRLDRIDPFIPLYRNRLATLQGAAVKRTPRLLANSEFTRRQFESDFHVPAPVVNLGVDGAQFHPLNEGIRDRHLLSVGELSPRKGFDFLVESLALVAPEKRPALRLACNNQIPEERAYIENLAAQRGVRLEILTNLNGGQLLLEYNQAQLCAYAPLQEPFGLVPLEAMACGTPVLAVAEGGVCESVREGFNGRLTPRDPRRFAAALEDLLEDPVELSRLGKNGRQDVLENWSWERSTGRLESHLLAAAARES